LDSQIAICAYHLFDAFGEISDSRSNATDEGPIGRRIEVGAPPRLLAEDECLDSQRVTVTIAGVMIDNRDQGLVLPVAPQLIGCFGRCRRENECGCEANPRACTGLNHAKGMAGGALH
jgi:hypothetical protein